MPRRKKHNSAFEFTGDEAEAAQQAFRLRHAQHTRKPKISVTSISPLSAISKLLHSRSPSKPTPSQPSKRLTPSKLSKKPSTTAKPTQSPTQNDGGPDKRDKRDKRDKPEQTSKPGKPGKPGKPSKLEQPSETPTQSPSLQTPSPARRSRRRKIPSFKLRGFAKPAAETTLDASHTLPAEIEAPSEAIVNPSEASNDDLRDEPLGKGQTEGLKRPRVACDSSEGDGLDKTVLSRVKRRRSHEEADDAEHPSAATVNRNDNGAGAEKNGVNEKGDAQSDAAKHADVSNGETDLKRVEETAVEIYEQGVTDVQNADGCSEGIEDGVAREEKETMDSDPAEKVPPKQNELDTTGTKTAEQSTESKTPTSPEAEKAVEPPESDEKDIFDDCDPILTEEQFPSLVTPQKEDSDGDTGAGPSQGQHNNDEVFNGAQKQVPNEEKKDDTDVQDATARDSLTNDACHEDKAAMEVDMKISMEKSEEERQKETEDAEANSSESVEEKTADSGEKDEKATAIAETITTSKKEEKQHPAKQESGEQEYVEQESVEQESAEQKSAEQESAGQESAGRQSAERQSAEQQSAEQQPAERQPAEQQPAKQHPANQESQSTDKRSVPRPESEKEMITLGKETEKSTKRSSITQKLHTAVERLSPGKQHSGATKRVRFSEPSLPYRASERKLGFSGIVKMRRRKIRRHRTLDTDLADVSVAGAGTNDSNKRERHLLLDELQYLLDGIFSNFTNGNKKGQTPDNDVVASSLQALIRLLLKRPAKSPAVREENQDEDSAVVVQILAEQPDLLKKIVIRFCSALGKSKTADALLALVFVLIFRGTPKLTLISEHELDLLLNAFFRSSGSSLKYNERDGQKPAEEKKQTGKEPQARRRGKLGRMLEQKKQKDDSLPQLLELMSASDIMEAGCTVFKTEADAAAHLMGTAISLLLRNESESRVWMRQNRRLDRVVAILYSCEKIMLSKPAEDSNHKSSPGIETGASWIVMEASLRVLEFAVLDPVCQRRLARESRVGSIIVDLLSTIKSIKTGPLESEWMICAALRLCINLCHGCEEASRQLVNSKGHEVVLSCLVKECLAAGLLQKHSTLLVPEDVEESFDVRVLCLAVLASTVNQEESVCNSFHEMHADSTPDPDRNAISLTLEILRTAELESKKEEGNQSGPDTETGTIRRTKTTREEEAERDRRAQFVMERKITIGYVCLLVGALACDSKPNRERIQGRLPGQSFLGIAAVLAEFLEFHHEVGVISGSMNRMYAEIIKKIVEPEAGKACAVDVATELDERNDNMDVEEELNEVGSELMDVHEPEEGGKNEVTDKTEQEKPADGETCEKTAVVAPAEEST